SSHHFLPNPAWPYPVAGQSSLYLARMNIMQAFLHPFPVPLAPQKSQLGHFFVTKTILWLATTRPKEGTEVLLAPASATFCKKKYAGIIIASGNHYSRYLVVSTASIKASFTDSE